MTLMPLLSEKISLVKFIVGRITQGIFSIFIGCGNCGGEIQWVVSGSYLSYFINNVFTKLPLICAQVPFQKWEKFGKSTSICQNFLP